MSHHVCLRVCIYNYKGGAGKTTLVVNLGAAFAKLGLKVLLIDLDAQCNTTQFFHDDTEGVTISKEGTLPSTVEQGATALNALNPQYPGVPFVLEDKLHDKVLAASMDALVDKSEVLENTLYKIFDTFFTARDVRGTQEELAKGFEGLQCCNGDTLGNNLWLLQGTPLIWKFEEEMSSAFTNPTRDESLKKYGIISYIIEQYTQQCKFDIVLIDCGPSNSAMNKAAALSCDCILPPCLPSLYSAGSIHGLLTTVLPGKKGWLGVHRTITDHWYEENGMVKEEEAEAEENPDWLLPKDPPKLLPILINNYPLEETSSEMAPKSAKKQKLGSSWSGKGNFQCKGCGGSKRAAAAKCLAPCPGGAGTSSAAPAAAVAPAKNDANDMEPTVKFSASQFVYTIKNCAPQKLRPSPPLSCTRQSIANLALVSPLVLQTSTRSAPLSRAARSSLNSWPRTRGATRSPSSLSCPTTAARSFRSCQPRSLRCLSQSRRVAPSQS